MDLKKVSPGKIPKQINVFIEIPQGTSVKYELDKESGLLVVDRFIYTSSVYPCNYGFIPNTLADDGDPLDVLVIATLPVQAGALISCRPIGLLQMEDESGIDTKIISIPIEKVDPFFAHIKNIEDLDESTKERIKYFFKRYKDLDPDKWSKVQNFKNKEAAYKEIKIAVKKKK